MLKTTVFRTKNSKTTGNVAKVVTGKPKKKDDTKTFAGNCVTVAAFVTKSN